ncbi:hypothetical protein B0A49_01070 [Cryomyces minteri]|uniref:Peptidase A1 domain-containing protein n=1 Tax=Cryomyces minteri TaxID=331657 RepID=A0A4U0XVP6_9PEZI|nr:hypothetical protein B0A49_01070 [Cryomyces minteri]
MSLSPRANCSIPSPFVFSPSQFWDGNDGSWSTFMIRVGTPEQDFRVLISTAGQETWVPLPEGCTSSDPGNCEYLRGSEPFQGNKGTGFLVNRSSTWQSIGLFDLALENTMNYSGNGLYGFDTVGLEVQNSGGLTQTHQVVAGIATKDFYLGMFGVGPKPSNFSSFNDPQPSYMKNLKDRGLIPSLSFGYTAGAPYRISKVLGSLTLGGYDQSRFVSNNKTFPFSADDSRPLSVGVQNILAINTLNGVVSPLKNGIISAIDSTIPHVWLPWDVCDQFERAFGLTYDASTDFYLVNDSIHAKLQQLNPSITFKLGSSAYNGDTINIVLPYAAFDLQATYPYVNATNYFPIRRAANASQYTIGRTFLQEAYIIADYERSNFTVAQATFPNPMPAENIVAINSPNSTLVSENNVQHGLGGGAIAGIVIGVLILLLILLSGIFVYRRRRTRAAAVETYPDDKKPDRNPKHGYETGKPELMSQDRYEMAIPPALYEIDGGRGSTAHEMHTPPMMHEMDGLMGGISASRVHELYGSDAMEGTEHGATLR